MMMIIIIIEGNTLLLLKLRPMGIHVRGNTTKVVRPAGYGNSTSCGANELRAVLK